MDNIKLPLKKGSLNDIEAAAPASSQDDAMDVDQPSQVCVKYMLPYITWRKYAKRNSGFRFRFRMF